MARHAPEDPGLGAAPTGTDRGVPDDHAELVARLREAEEAIEAIRSGGVDSLIIGPPGDQRVFSLTGADRPYRLVVERSRDGIAILSPDGQILYANPTLNEWFAHLPNQLLGTSIRDLVAPGYRATLDAMLVPALDAAERCELELDRIDGVQRPVLASVAELADDGSLRGLLLTDVTDLRRQRLVAQSEAARRQAVLDSLLDPHVLLRAVRDATGCIVDFVFADANDAACEYNQTPRDQLIGAHLLDLFPGAAGAGLLGMYVEAVESGVPLILNDYRYPNEIQQEERYYDIRAVRVEDSLSFTWRDVTELREASRRIAESERQLRLLAENSSDVIALFRDGHVAWVSPAITSTLGGLPETWIGRDLAEMLHPDDRPEYEEFQRSGGLESPIVRRVRVTGSDGQYHWIESHMSPYVDEEGRADGIVANIRVVDDLVAAEAALAESEERFRLLAVNASEMVVLTSAFKVVWASPSTLAFFGLTEDQLVGADIRDFASPEAVEMNEAVYEAVVGGESSLIRLNVLGGDGAQHWIEAHMGPYRGRSAEESGVLISARVVDALVAAEQELDYRARFDTLTGLANRKEILQRITSLTTSSRKPGEYTAILFCDIDHFKEVNDTYGHAAGDEVLRTLSERISANVRQDDVAARIGGDELLVVLTGIHSIDEAAAIAEKIRDAASVSIGLEKGRVTATLSIGVTLVHPRETTDDLVARADQAMYDAKQGGRNRVIAIP